MPTEGKHNWDWQKNQDPANIPALLAEMDQSIFPIYNQCSTTEVDELTGIYWQGKSGWVYKHYQAIVFI